MSLIDEALRKARTEAARQDTERRGLPAAAAAGLPGRARRPRTRGPLLAGLAIGGAIAALAAGLGFYVAGMRGTPGSAGAATPAAPAATASEVAAGPRPADPAGGGDVPAAAGGGGAGAGEPSAPVPPAPTTAAGERADGGKPGAGVTAATPPPLPPASRPAAEPAPSEPEAVAAPRPPTVTPPAPTAKPATPPSSGHGTATAGESAGPVYRRSAPLPGGAKLVLSGIAWRETDPVAVLNLEVVGPGEGVNGCLVLAIERDRVHLRGPDGEPFTLLVR